MTFETEGSHRNIDQGTRLTGRHDHKRLTASTNFIDTAVEFHFVGEIHCWPLYANVRVVAPVVGCSLVLAGNVRAVGLDQRWTAVCFQNECCVLSAYTQTAESSAAPGVCECVLVTCRTVRVSCRFEDLDVRDEALVPFADNLVRVVKIIAE